MSRHLTISLILLLWAHPVSADVLEMIGGERVEGVLKEATPAGVLIEIAGQSIRFELSKVRAIYFGALGVAPPQLPTVSAPSAREAERPIPPGVGALPLLQSLRSAVALGMSQREYESRVDRTAPLVDLYLANSLAPVGVAALRDAMRYYVLAEWAWSNQAMASRTVWLKKDDALANCPAYQDFAREMQQKGEAYYAERVRSYLVIADGVIPVLWSCAADKIAEVEKLVVSAR